MNPLPRRDPLAGRLDGLFDEARADAKFADGV
jgi:hypothetical protein